MHVLIIRKKKGLRKSVNQPAGADVREIGYIIHVYVETQRSCSIAERVDGMSF